ncbi:hypothetical protein LQK93_02875 [Terrabacter sp. BE26]
MRRNARSHIGRLRLATVGLAIFLAADVALAVVALRPPELGPSERTAASGTGTPVSTSSLGLSVSSAPAQPQGPAPLTRMIVAVDKHRAWLASVGTCADGGGLVQASSDGGRTWSVGSAPARAIGRVQPLGNGRGFAYAAARDCQLVELTTDDDGRSWSRPKRVEEAWTRLVSDSHVVVTPRAGASRPCGGGEVVDLARATASQAAALCADGTIRRTLDGGVKWSDAGAVPGALTIASREENGSTATYTAGPALGCAGIAIIKVAPAAPPLSTVACLSSTAAAAAGTISLSVARQAGWLAVGAQTWVSNADLNSWKRPAS